MIRIVWKCSCGNVNETQYKGNLVFDYRKPLTLIETDLCLLCHQPYEFNAKLYMNAEGE